MTSLKDNFDLDFKNRPGTGMTELTRSLGSIFFFFFLFSFLFVFSVPARPGRLLFPTLSSSCERPSNCGGQRRENSLVIQMLLRFFFYFLK